ncbi:MAG: gamma-glutamylcyclotransferase family protein [bacterium]
MVAGGQTAIVGELYRVDAARLAALDAFEEHPEVYRRTPVPLEGGGVAEAWVLRAHLAAGRPAIPGGDWRRRGPFGAPAPVPE